MITARAVVLRHQQREDGTFVVKMRITSQRKSSYFMMPYKVTKYQLDSTGNIKDRTVARQVNADVLKAEQTIASNFSKLSLYSSKEIADYIYKALYHAVGDDIKYVPFARELIEEKRNAGGGNWNMYKYTLSRLIQYVGHEDFLFNDITVRFLDGFDRWMIAQGVGDRGRKNYLATIRATINEAKYRYNDEDRGLIRIPGDPFSRFRMPRPGLPPEKALTVTQMKELIAYVPKDKYEQLAKDVFMLSFFLVGMNTVDLYNCSDFKNGRITYRRTKTFRRRQDHAEISIRLEPEAEALYNKYRCEDGSHVFNFHKLYKDYRGFNHQVNKFLKRIGEALEFENFTFYSARHTWSSILVNECHEAESEAAFCLNHVSAHKVTSGYIRKDYSRIDRANRMVIDTVNTNNLLKN